jgi:hypothetical protein
VEDDIAWWEAVKLLNQKLTQKLIQQDTQHPNQENTPPNPISTPES